MFDLKKLDTKFIILFLVALILRVYRLDHFGLWNDEGFTFGLSSNGPFDIISESFTYEPNPPLYNLFLHVWMKIFGISEFALRFPSAVFGALSVALLYLIGKKIISDKAGVVAAILVMAHPFYMEHSQEVRGYSMLCFTSLLSMYYFPFHYDFKNKKTFIFVSLLAPWTHAYGIFVLVAQNIYVLLKKYLDQDSVEKNRFMKEWVRVQSLILLICCPWYVSFLLKSDVYQNRFKWISKIDPPGLDEIFRVYIGFNLPSFFLLILGGGVTLAFLYRFRKIIEPAWLLVIWLLITIAFPLVADYFWYSFFVIKYSIAASMIVSLLVAAIFSRFMEKSHFRYALVLFFAGVYAGASANHFYKNDQREDWKSIIQAIDLKEGQRVPVILFVDYDVMKEPVVEYYLDQLKLRDKIDMHYTQRLSEVDQLIKDKKNVWIILLGDEVAKSFNIKNRYIEVNKKIFNYAIHLRKVECCQTN